MTIWIEKEYESAWTIGFVVDDGKNRVREYLDKLKKKHKTKELSRILGEMKRFGDCGHHPSREFFAPEGDGVFAIKNGQERIYGFFVGKNFFACAAGTTKKTQKADPALLLSVKGIKRRYEEQQSAQRQHREQKKGQ